MSLQSAVVGHLLYPAHERLKGKTTFPWLRRLESSQWWSRDRLLEYQNARLRDLVAFATQHVPYYGGLFRTYGIDPEGIRTTDDLRAVPFMTRRDLRANFDGLRARISRRGVKPTATGGSTGEPVTILVDMQRIGFGEGSRLRAHRWFGLEPGAREIVLWGSPIELGRQDLVRTVRDRLLNSRLLSAFDLSEAALARYAGVVTRYRPTKMYGYASALYLLARWGEANGWYAPANLRAVFTTAEPLFDFQRKAIESVFGCPVAVEYGARDAGLIANECPEGRLHIPVEGIHVEILDPDAHGIGEIAVTVLDSHAFPTIRYRTGDVGRLDPSSCPCGRELPTLGSIEGRQTDFIVTPDGRCLHALALIYPLREMPGLKAFQVVQDTIDSVRVSIVPEGDFALHAESTVREALRSVVGDSVQVRVSTVDTIARTASGKFRYVVSHVANEVLESRWAARQSTAPAR